LHTLSRLYDLQSDRGIKPKSEHLYWVPAQALRFAEGFRLARLPEVPRAVWADALAGLNAVWMERLVTVCCCNIYHWKELILAVILVVKWWLLDICEVCKRL
jgi:hypothetical protein